MAAIAIMGTLLASAVLARSRHAHQLALARRKQVAVHAADELITRWWADPPGPPIGESGGFETDESMTWSTRLVESGPLKDAGCRVLRVEFRDGWFPHDPTADEVGDPPLLVVDLVLPPPPAAVPSPTKGDADE